MACESHTLYQYDREVACGQAVLDKSKPETISETGSNDKKGVTIMLVLTRKLAEGIRIGDDILVKVIRTGKGSIKIGIDAPDHFRITREELFDEEECEPVLKGRGEHQDGGCLPEHAPLGVLSVAEAARLVC